MTWDLGLEGLGVLGLIALGFGAFAALIVGRGVRRRVWAAAATAVCSFVLGLVTSELLFGWATEEDLQPNVDGLSRDEVLLAGLLTTAVVVVVVRYRTRHDTPRDAPHGWHLSGHGHGRHAGHA
ncbi:MAG TPA: hypothetical protein VNS55_11505 [Nocardioides sp.]|nr:hypothetical protein [Nocardioides sp.]